MSSLPAAEHSWGAVLVHWLLMISSAMEQQWILATSRLVMRLLHFSIAGLLVAVRASKVAVTVKVGAHRDLFGPIQCKSCMRRSRENGLSSRDPSRSLEGLGTNQSLSRSRGLALME